MTIVHGEPMEILEWPKPYVAAYVRRHLLMSAGEMARAQQRLISFARSRGLDIDEIFVEELETIPEAFAKMAERLIGPGERVVILPGVHHISGLGSPPLVVIDAFTADGVQVLIAGHVE